MKELAEFMKIMNKLEQVHKTLPGKAATVAVNFTKRRFRQQNWLDKIPQPWEKRKTKVKGRRNNRAILVDKGILKRDVQKTYESASRAIVGTSNLTIKYAKAHNEGFKGTVKVKEHRRRQFNHITERVTTRSGKTRKQTRKELVTDKKPGIVKSHLRKMNIVMRKYLGVSAALDTEIQDMMTNEYVTAIKSA